MKYFKLTAGSLLVLFAVLNGSRVLTSTQDIASYDKGYLLGQAILLLLGVILLYFSLRKPNS